MPGRRKLIEAEMAQPIELPPAVDEAGSDTGVVEIKTRIPIHLHIALVAAAERNDRSIAAELRTAIRGHVERQAGR